MKPQGELKIHAYIRPEQAHQLNLVAYIRDRSTGAVWVPKVSWDKQDNEAISVEALLSISEYEDEAIASLADDLWRIGLRPSTGEFRGTEGQLAMAEKHIADLRKIAFHALKIRSP